MHIRGRPAEPTRQQRPIALSDALCSNRSIFAPVPNYSILCQPFSIRVQARRQIGTVEAPPAPPAPPAPHSGSCCDDTSSDVPRLKLGSLEPAATLPPWLGDNCGGKWWSGTSEQVVGTGCTELNQMRNNCEPRSLQEKQRCFLCFLSLGSTRIVRIVGRLSPCLNHGD